MIRCGFSFFSYFCSKTLFIKTHKVRALFVWHPKVAARSRQLLIEYNSPSAEQRRALFVSAVKAVTAAAAEGDNNARQSSIDSFVSQSAVMIAYARTCVLER